MKVRMKPSRAEMEWRQFVKGAAVDGGEALVAWLDTQRGVMLRLPVSFSPAPENVLAQRRAWLGSVATVGAAKLLEIRLDDTALGIALPDQLRTFCPDKGTGCLLWLEGTWGPLVDGPPLPFVEQSALPVVAVRRVVGLVDDVEQAGYIYVAASS